MKGRVADRCCREEIGIPCWNGVPKSCELPQVGLFAVANWNAPALRAFQVRRLCVGLRGLLAQGQYWCRVREFHPQPFRSERSVSCSWTNAAKIFRDADAAVLSKNARQCWPNAQIMKTG